MRWHDFIFDRTEDPHRLGIVLANCGSSVLLQEPSALCFMAYCVDTDSWLFLWAAIVVIVFLFITIYALVSWVRLSIYGTGKQYTRVEDDGIEFQETKRFYDGGPELEKREHYADDDDDNDDVYQERYVDIYGNGGRTPINGDAHGSSIDNHTHRLNDGTLIRVRSFGDRNGSMDDYDYVDDSEEEMDKEEIKESFVIERVENKDLNGDSHHLNGNNHDEDIDGLDNGRHDVGHDDSDDEDGRDSEREIDVIQLARQAIANT